MEKCLSIVLSSDVKNYRKVAQVHWGLTDAQMKGKHVHHHPAVSEGGRNVPEHLYVCSPSMHAHGWHSEAYFIEWAIEAGRSTKGLKRSDTAKENNRKAQKGRNKGKTHWHNPETLEEKFAVSPPGPGWVKGMSETHKENCYRPNKKIAVVCVLPDGGEVEYESAYDAARDTGKDRGDIGKCCRGQKRKTGDLHWRYAESQPG
jgi:hypothetical protein